MLIGNIYPCSIPLPTAVEWKPRPLWLNTTRIFMFILITPTCGWFKRHRSRKIPVLPPFSTSVLPIVLQVNPLPGFDKILQESTPDSGKHSVLIAATPPTAVLVTCHSPSAIWWCSLRDGSCWEQYNARQKRYFMCIHIASRSIVLLVDTESTWNVDCLALDQDRQFEKFPACSCV